MHFFIVSFLSSFDKYRKKQVIVSRIRWLTLCHQSVAFPFLLDKETFHVRHCVHLHFRFHFGRDHFSNQLTLNIVEKSSNLLKTTMVRDEELTKFNKCWETLWGGTVLKYSQWKERVNSTEISMWTMWNLELKWPVNGLDGYGGMPRPSWCISWYSYAIVTLEETRFK